jgi:hypothetical protein
MAWRVYLGQRSEIVPAIEDDAEDVMLLVQSFRL